MSIGYWVLDMNAASQWIAVCLGCPPSDAQRVSLGRRRTAAHRATAAAANDEAAQRAQRIAEEDECQREDVGEAVAVGGRLVIGVLRGAHHREDPHRACRRKKKYTTLSTQKLF